QGSPGAALWAAPGSATADGAAAARPPAAGAHRPLRCAPRSLLGILPRFGRLSRQTVDAFLSLAADDHRSKTVGSAPASSWHPSARRRPRSIVASRHFTASQFGFPGGPALGTVFFS